MLLQELNRRWPFIIGAKEDDRCPGLLIVECSSHLTISQLPELSRHQEGQFTNNHITEPPESQGEFISQS